MHGAGIAVIEGELDFDRVFEHVAARLPLLPRYRQRLAFVPFNLAHPKWVDDPNFDLANHLKAHQLAPDSTLQDALDTAMQLSEPLLPRDRPLWAMYLIQGVRDRTILLQLAHHAMVDGASGVDISTILFDLQPSPPPRESANATWQPAPLPDPMALATEAITETTQSFRAQRFQMSDYRGKRGEMLRRATESMSRFMAEPVVTAPWNASLVSLKRQFRYRKYGFASLRQIRNTLGGTINDVVLAIVVEAAARYLQNKGTNTTGQHLRVMCPVNVRREDEQGTLGNHVSGIFPMFNAQVMDMAERLQTVTWETETIKQNREAQALQLLMDTIPTIPPVAMVQSQLVGSRWDPTASLASFSLPIMPQFGLRLPMMGFNFTCTNMPGVQTTQYLAGHKILENLAVLMLAGNLGYGVAVLSYDRDIYINLVCDPRLMPDLDAMATLIDQTYQELLATAEIDLAS